MNIIRRGSVRINLEMSIGRKFLEPPDMTSRLENSQARTPGMSESDCPKNDHEWDSSRTVTRGSPPASPRGTVPLPCTPRAGRR